MPATSSQTRDFFGGYNRSDFPSPWLDLATQSMPDHNKNALEWCEYIWQHDSTYRSARERKISYFNTDVEISAANPTREQLGDDEKEKYDNFLRDTLGITDVIRALDTDRECYGNGFASLLVPFKRLLVCPKCFSQYPLKVMADNKEFDFRFENFKFVATCPNCKTGSGYRGVWVVNDQPDDLEKKLKIKIWSVHEMELLHDNYSGDTAYVWKIPDDYKRAIRKGNLFELERAPLQVIEAVRNNQVFLFEPDVIFHMKEPTLGGLKNRGWGISRTLTDFRNIWYVQVLRRYNEAIALDYIVPFRVITPDVRPGASGGGMGMASDPLLTVDMGDFSSQVRRMLKKRRINPTLWHTLPFPIKYQALGGEATALAPRELLDQGLETMLNGAGVPIDMYRGSMQIQAAPVSLRLFEATNHSLVNDNNRFLRWVISQVSQLLSWEVVQARMQRVVIADDFNKQMALLQLMMGQAISQSTGLKPLGLDFKDEKRTIAEEARYEAQMQAEVQEEMEQSAFGEQIAKGQPGGGAPGQQGGGQPPAGGGQVDPNTGQPVAGPVTGMTMSSNTPITPQDMLAQADSLANQLLGLPESQKDSELRALKQKNEILHGLVRAKMDSIRQKARTAGGAMLLGQQGAAPQQ